MTSTLTVREQQGAVDSYILNCCRQRAEMCSRLTLSSESVSDFSHSIKQFLSFFHYFLFPVSIYNQTVAFVKPSRYHSTLQNCRSPRNTNVDRTAKKTPHFPFIKICLLMLLREIIRVCTDNPAKPIYTKCRVIDWSRRYIQLLLGFKGLTTISKPRKLCGVITITDWEICGLKILWLFKALYRRLPTEMM
jgi:hypothetical protein